MRWSEYARPSDFADNLDRLQPGADGAFRLIFKGLRPAEIGQHAVTKIFRHIAAIAGDGTGHGVLVAAHDVAQIFRIQLPR